MTIEEITEERSIKTTVNADGSVTRVETITTKAPSKQSLNAHLGARRTETGRPEAEPPSIFESIFGRSGRRF